MPMQSKADEAVDVIVSLTVVGLLSAFLIPIAVEEIVAVDTSGWSSGATELWAIMDLAIVLPLFIGIIGMALVRRR